MRFLADTCFISDVRRRIPGPLAWLASVPASDLFISVITLGEIARGIEMRRRRDEPIAQRLEAWLNDDVRRGFVGRILPVTEQIVQAWGGLSAQRSRPVVDALIAATALVHGLAVVTRNVADFEDAGVVVVTPWETGQ